MDIAIARRDGMVNVVSYLLLLAALGACVAGLWLRVLLPLACALVGVVLLTYFLWTPVGYSLASGRLRVHFRLLSLDYGAVTRAARYEGPVCGWFGLWRNGGGFAVSGIFWTRALGRFRAHLTTMRPEMLVLVETEGYKVILSPADVEEALKALGAGAAA
jgi:hypothetical protein